MINTLARQRTPHRHLMLNLKNLNTLLFSLVKKLIIRMQPQIIKMIHKQVHMVMEELGKVVHFKLEALVNLANN